MLLINIVMKHIHVEGCC